MNATAAHEEWVEALGFRLITSSKLSSPYWRNDELDLSVIFNYPPQKIVAAYRARIEQRTKESVLRPIHDALGLKDYARESQEASDAP